MNYIIYRKCHYMEDLKPSHIELDTFLIMLDADLRLYTQLSKPEASIDYVVKEIDYNKYQELVHKLVVIKESLLDLSHTMKVAVVEKNNNDLLACLSRIECYNRSPEESIALRLAEWFGKAVRHLFDEETIESYRNNLLNYTSKFEDEHFKRVLNIITAFS